jgi:hypothetical protein
LPAVWRAIAQVERHSSSMMLKRITAVACSSALQCRISTAPR